MNLKLKILDPDCKDIKTFEKINNEAFPIYERMCMDEIFSFASDTDTDVLEIYDNSLPIGFAVILKNEKCGYLYYLAIDKSFRSKGYGGAALKKIIASYPDLQIILDFEEIDANAENNNQRIRRKNFYLKNGFYETGFYTLLGEIRFEVVCSELPLRKESFCDLLNILHAHRPEFSDSLR